MSTTTTQMGLTVPQIGDPSPGYASDIASSLFKLDTHDHSSGNGKQITQSGINLTGPLPLNSQTLSQARSVLFAPQSILTSAADNASLFVNGSDLYYLDGNNVLVRLTTGGKSAGAISGDYSNYPLAQVSYSNPDLTYYFRDSANNFAKINSLSLALGTSSATSSTIAVGNPGGGTGFQFKDSSNVNAKLYTGAIDTGVAGISTNSLAVTNGISAASATASGTVTAGNFSTSGGLGVLNVTATGTVQAATLTATGTPGTVNANNLSVSGSSTVNTLNATGGVLQGSRIIALRGVVKAGSIQATGGGTPITAYVDGATPAFAQTTLTPPYAGSIAALTVRTYGATATAGTIQLQTSGLSTNASTPAFGFATVNSGAAQTFTPGTYIFAAGTAFTVNVINTSWAQTITGATGVDVTVWVYA